MFKYKEVTPKAALLLALFVYKASLPTAVFSEPVVFVNKANAPRAVLFEAVVLFIKA